MSDRVVQVKQLTIADFGSSVLVNLKDDEYVAGKLRGIRAEHEPELRLANGTVHSWSEEIEIKVASLWVPVRHNTEVRISEE